MKKFHRRYRHTLSLGAVLLALVASIYLIHMPVLIALLMLGCWQLAQIAMAPRLGRCFVGALTDEQIKEFDKVIVELKALGAFIPGIKELAAAEGGFAAIKALPESLKKHFTDYDELKGQVGKLRKENAKRLETGVRWIGVQPFVTDDCAKAITSVMVLDTFKMGGEKAMRGLNPNPSSHQRLLECSASNLGLELKAALDTTEIPVPTVYVPQITELVWKYGQARQYATVYPLGNGTVKLPRLKAGEDDFGFLGVGYAGMSQAIPEKRVTAELITFTANKAGGLIRIPSELEEDTFIQLGQFLARYIARQLAKLEDKTMFLGDGSGTYANITGVAPYCLASAAGVYLQQLAATKTIPTQATIADFRAMRAKVNPAVLVDDPAYYMNPTMEALLVTFNTIGAPLIYRPAMGGQPATLDGFPIRWTAVMQPYTNAAAAATAIALFGALRYWFLGERGAPRVEVSREVFFATDELAMRALERIDVEAMAIDAMSALYTAAQ